LDLPWSNDGVIPSPVFVFSMLDKKMQQEG
jgi:hypothetical protein